MILTYAAYVNFVFSRRRRFRWSRPAEAFHEQPYLELFAAPGAKGFSAAGLLARMPR